MNVTSKLHIYQKRVVEIPSRCSERWISDGWRKGRLQISDIEKAEAKGVSQSDSPPTLPTCLFSIMI